MNEAMERASLALGRCPACTSALPECEPCGSTGTVGCWNPGGPCPVLNDPGCEACGGCVECGGIAICGACGEEWFR